MVAEVAEVAMIQASGVLVVVAASLKWGLISTTVT
jgi:hypothetical protein